MLEQLNLEFVISSAIRENKVTARDPELNLSLKLLDLNNELNLEHHLYDQDLTYYPASLIKLFHCYLAKVRNQERILDYSEEMAARQELGAFGSRTDQDDIYDAVISTLKDSDNDALSYLVDFNTFTNSGTRLFGKDFEDFKNARIYPTRLFQQKGYSADLNIANKCFSFAAYGRDYQLAYEDDGLGINRVSINDICRIMLDLQKDFPELLKFMQRDIANKNDYHNQFIVKGLNSIMEQVDFVQSKAGWTSKVRHDAAFIKMKNGRNYLLVILTKGLSEYTELIPSISKKIFTELLN